MLKCMQRLAYFCVAFFLVAYLPLTGADPARAVDTLLAQVPKGGSAAIAMAELDSRSWVIRRNADRSMSLASVTKLLISAGALLELGADYRFTTTLVALGPTNNGSIPGLGIIGGGDPCFDEHFAPQRDPDNVFRSFANELRKQGIQHIAGDIIIDASLFSGPIRPATWPQDQVNQQRWFSAPASAFAWNDNCIEVRIVPRSSGQPCDIQIRPNSPRIRVVNQTRSITGGAGRNAISRALSSNTITVSGTCGQATAWFPLAIAEEPDLLIADHVKYIFGLSGITVSGQPRLGTVTKQSGTVVHEVRSPLVPALSIFNQNSHNFYGEQLLRLLGVARQKEGSISAGCVAVTAILEEKLGAGMGPFTVLDGCGLSYGNVASATYLVNLLDGMHRHPLGALYRESLKERPAPGVRGLVKTGTHNEARTLAGYFSVPQGKSYAFAILLNRAESSSIGWADKLREQLYQALAKACLP
jgi:serine-type D-Ala-D-Ala carboxypeptidase/endopeptidase (penicillin-binding protein 4)